MRVELVELRELTVLGEDLVVRRVRSCSEPCAPQGSHRQPGHLRGLLQTSEAVTHLWAEGPDPASATALPSTWAAVVEHTNS